MPNTKRSAGDPIEARCTKCRKITNHTIIAMTEKGPAKVSCNTCQGEHKYRPPAASKKASGKRAAETKEPPREVWQELIAGMDEAQAKPYSMEGTYKQKNLIKHPKFGLGLVQRVVGNRKIEVLFADGQKTMRCR